MLAGNQAKNTQVAFLQSSIYNYIINEIAKLFLQKEFFNDMKLMIKFIYGTDRKSLTYRLINITIY